MALFAAMSVLAAACSDGNGGGAIGGPDQPRPVANVAVQPSEHTILVGDEYPLTAKPLDADGAVIEGRTIQWSSSDETIARVDAAGKVTALAAGTVTIRATVDGKVGSALLLIALVPVEWVELTPATLSLEQGNSHALVAVAHDIQGRVLPGRAFGWSSSNTAVAEVDATGKITAKTVGSATITAAVEGKSASVALTVTTPAVAWIGVTPTALVMSVGETRQLTATVKDARGNVLTGRQITWSSEGAATVTATGLVTGVQTGYATITATSEGKSFSVAVTVVLAESPSAFDLLYFKRLDPSGAEIYALPLGAGAVPVRINAGSVSSQPTAHPSGARIAFTVNMIDPGTHQQIADIFAVDRNGMNMKRLTTAAGYDDMPAWSPDGSRIAYRHFTTGGRYDIWVMNADGTGQTNLTADMAESMVRGSPAWSPDGTHIAFASKGGDFITAAAIWTMRADGSEKRPITSTQTGDDSWPTWAPDGQHIAFVREYENGADIAIVSASGGEPVRVTLPGRQLWPAWSPDGEYIAYGQEDGMLYNVYTMNPNGANVRLRTTDPAWGGGLGPRWIHKP